MTIEKLLKKLKNNLLKNKKKKISYPNKNKYKNKMMKIHPEDKKPNPGLLKPKNKKLKKSKNWIESEKKEHKLHLKKTFIIIFKKLKKLLNKTN